MAMNNMMRIAVSKTMMMRVRPSTTSSSTSLSRVLTTTGTTGRNNTNDNDNNNNLKLLRSTTHQQQQQHKRGFASAAAAVSTAPAAGASSTATAATSEAIQQSANQVKEAIKKMMLDRQHGSNIMMEVLHPIEDEELDQSFQQFQNILHEAELCIADLKEAAASSSTTTASTTTEIFDEELKCAEGSVELAFNACVDLLDDLRRAGDEQLHKFSDERHENALRLKKLRHEMDEIVQNHNR